MNLLFAKIQNFSDYIFGNTGIPTEIILLIRILFAILLGFAIGYERKLRFKEASVRTHAVVACGAGIMAIISKYAFFDSASFDASRVASQVVSGIGFIGAGMILYKRENLHGLTTAAGIWTTAGIGMCAGAGLYWVALGGTALLILAQCVLHLNVKAFKTKKYAEFKVEYTDYDGASVKVKELFGCKNFIKTNVKRVNGQCVCTVYFVTDKDYADSFFAKVVNENEFILSIVKTDSI